MILEVCLSAHSNLRRETAQECRLNVRQIAECRCNEKLDEMSRKLSFLVSEAPGELGAQRGVPLADNILRCLGVRSLPRRCTVGWMSVPCAGENFIVERWRRCKIRITGEIDVELKVD